MSERCTHTHATSPHCPFHCTIFYLKHFCFTFSLGSEATVLHHFVRILVTDEFCLSHEETSPHLLFGAQDQRLGVKRDQLPSGSTGTSSGKRRKHAWFGHVTRHDSLFKTILQGTLQSERRRSRPSKFLMDNFKEWTSLPMPQLFTGVSCRKDRKRISADPPPPPTPPPPSPDVQNGQGSELTELN